MKILVIDDKRHPAITFLKNIETYNVTHLTDIDYIKKHLSSNSYEIIILDVKLDSGKYGEKVTHEGLITGYILYKDIIEKLSSKVIVWSVLIDKIESLQWGDNVVSKVKKDESDPNQLINLISKI